MFCLSRWRINRLLVSQVWLDGGCMTYMWRLADDKDLRIKSWDERDFMVLLFVLLCCSSTFFHVTAPSSPVSLFLAFLFARSTKCSSLASSKKPRNLNCGPSQWRRQTSLAQVEKQRAFLLWPNELLLLATTTPVLLLRTIIVRLRLLQSTSLDLPKRRRQRHKFRNKFIQHFLHLRLSQKFTLQIHPALPPPSSLPEVYATYPE
jgi:hypothetical protein